VGDEFSGVDPLEDVARGPDPQGLEEVVLVVIDGQEHNAHVGVGPCDRLAQVDAAGAAQADVAQHDVRGGPGNHGQRVLVGRGRARDHHVIGEVREHRGQALQNHLVIVDEDEPHRRLGTSRRLHARS
jgi:hypothetical protein